MHRSKAPGSNLPNTAVQQAQDDLPSRSTSSHRSIQTDNIRQYVFLLDWNSSGVKDSKGSLTYKHATIQICQNNYSNKKLLGVLASLLGAFLLLVTRTFQNKNNAKIQISVSGISLSKASAAGHPSPAQVVLALSVELSQSVIHRQPLCKKACLFRRH